MKKLVTIILTVALMSAAASAAPVLLYDTPEFPTADLGGGLFRYTFVLDGNDGLEKSLATSTLRFTGDIQQVKAFFSISVDDEDNADTFDAMNGPAPAPDAFYDKALDTWMFSGWDLIAPGNTAIGPDTGDPVILSVGSGSSTFYEKKPLIQIVALGDVEWTGGIARDGNQFQSSGTAGPPSAAATLIKDIYDGAGNPRVRDQHPKGPYTDFANEPGGGPPHDRNFVHAVPFGEPNPGHPNFGIWLNGEGTGGVSYKWTLSGGSEGLAEATITSVIDTDSDGDVDPYFLTFAELASMGALDRSNQIPYVLKLIAVDGAAGIGNQVGDDSQIHLFLPEPATMGLMLFGSAGLLARKRRRR